MQTVSQIIVAQLDDPVLLWDEFKKWALVMESDLGKDAAEQRSAEYLGFLDKDQLRNYCLDITEKNRCTHTQ